MNFGRAVSPRDSAAPGKGADRRELRFVLRGFLYRSAERCTSTPDIQQCIGARQQQRSQNYSGGTEQGNASHDRKEHQQCMQPELLSKVVFE